MSSNLTLSARLLRRKRIIPETGCWEWQGALTVGYGRIKVAGAVLLTHRLAYEVFVWPIHGDLHVCHRCDNRRCINPQHLFLGTPKDNMQDCIAKGRFVVNGFPRGEKHYAARLTDQEIAEIRSVPKGKGTNELAAKYKISARYVRQLREGKCRIGPGTGVQPSLARKAS